MLQKLQACVTDFLNTVSHLPNDRLIAHHRIASMTHALYGIVKEAENAKFPRSDILDILRPVRTLSAQSPFIARTQTWPRGYVGDFETIEYICENTVRADSNTVGFYLEYQALNSIASQQHRNKIQWQSECIRKVAFSGQKAHILSLACGSSRDIRAIHKSFDRTKALFFLNDLDSEALQYSIFHLEGLLSQIQLIPGNVFKSIGSFEKYKPYHLILAGGLFDYLKDRQIEWLMPKLVNLLHLGGSLCFTNIANDNPDRIFMEYLCNWQIIERSEVDIERLVDNSCNTNNINLSIERDPSGLTLLVKLNSL